MRDDARRAAIGRCESRVPVELRLRARAAPPRTRACGSMVPKSSARRWIDPNACDRRHRGRLAARGTLGGVCRVPREHSDHARTLRVDAAVRCGAHAALRAALHRDTGPRVSQGVHRARLDRAGGVAWTCCLDSSMAAGPLRRCRGRFGPRVDTARRASASRGLGRARRTHRGDTRTGSWTSQSRLDRGRPADRVSMVRARTHASGVASHRHHHDDARGRRWIVPCGRIGWAARGLRRGVEFRWSARAPHGRAVDPRSRRRDRHALHQSPEPRSLQRACRDTSRHTRAPHRRAPVIPRIGRLRRGSRARRACLDGGYPHGDDSRRRCP